MDEGRRAWMKVPYRLGLFAFSLGAIGVLSAACAASGEESRAVPPSPTDDGGSSIPSRDAEVEPDVDAATDAAAPSVCSDHGFCHTTLPPEQTLQGVWGDDAGIVWAVSSEGSILRWDGVAWTVHSSGLGSLRTVWGSSATDIWIGGDEGVYHGTGPSSNALSFVASAGSSDVQIESIWGISPTEVWAVGISDGSGRIYRLFADVDGGSEWALDPDVPSGIDYSAVWGSASAGLWLGGMWQPPGEWYLAATVLHRSGSDRFSEVALPMDPRETEPFGLPMVLVGGLATSGTTVVILGMTMGGYPSRWHGTSSDKGETFSYTYARDSINQEPELYAVFGSAPNDVWAVGEHGRVRHWDGAAWIPQGITLTNLPVTATLRAGFSRGPSEAWMVGDQIALRFDKSRVKVGGAR